LVLAILTSWWQQRNRNSTRSTRLSAERFSLLQEFGPQLGRPRVDTLKGSRYANMKELRFKRQTANGE